MTFLGEADEFIRTHVEVAGPDFAQVLQLATQHDPKPPFKGGTPETAPDHIVEFARENAATVLS